jgi:dipeptidyl aminopeptidase/acylaminoacyl peptidase
MLHDLRATELYREIAQFCGDVRRPGSGQISDAAQLQLSPSGATIAFTATVAEQVEAEPPTRLALTALATGETSLVSQGPNSERLPRFSADGQRIAFLSDRQCAGDFQLHLLDLESRTVRATPKVNGQVEHLSWSADGGRILLRVVGAKQIVSEPDADLPAWLPMLEPSERHGEWRSCWLYDPATDTVRQLDVAEGAIWEASWCDATTLVTVASDLPGENEWYRARLCLLDLATERQRTLYAPREQLGPPVASPDGTTIAVVEGLCSDRGPVIGDLLLIDVATGERRAADTAGVDIIQAEWRGEHLLLLSGYRGLASVVGLYDAAADRFREIWSSEALSITGTCIAGLGAPGDCVIITEGFRTAPEIATLVDGRYRVIRSLDIGYAAATVALAAVERVDWPSADGLAIEGLLLQPHGPAPYPVIAAIHGGPVSHWRPGFLVRRLLHIAVLLQQGYAVFLPNPRGSSGRGQDFARRVLGDLGGGDAQDILTGFDFLVARGIADPARLGITGVSYGGFMTAWLIAESDRFAAAVAVSPHTNQVTAHLLSNIPGFMAHLLGDEIGNPGGRYFERSPVFRARDVRTPTLSIGGALDRCTPAGEAAQFHQALREAGVESALAIYPQEGHGVRRLPAAIDCTARLVGWMTDHIPIGR